MKTICNKIVYAVVVVLAIASLCSCSKNLNRDEAKKLISEKYKFPYADMAVINPPVIKIWTFDWDDWVGGWPPRCKGMCKPYITIDEIVKSGNYSNLVGFLSKDEAVLKRIYLARGDFELYKKYKDLGLIEFQTIVKDRFIKPMQESGYESNDGNGWRGFYWTCIFSLTSKANEVGINDWQYKAAEWVLDDVTGIFNNEANKTADVEFTIKTANPTSTAKLFGEWTEKKQNLKTSFKLYDDGWRIE